MIVTTPEIDEKLIPSLLDKPEYDVLVHVVILCQYELIHSCTNVVVV